MNTLGRWISFLGVTSVALVVACGVGADGAYDGEHEHPSPTATDGGDPTPAPSITPVPPPAGQLTAADFDDNLNYDWYEDFATYFSLNFPGYPVYPASDRVTIHVVDLAGTGVPSALVTVKDAGGVRFTGPTGDDGRALFLPDRDGAGGLPPTGDFSVLVQAPGETAPETFTATAATDWTFTLTQASAQLPASLDLAFVLDATGSMADEMGYLQTEVDSIASYVSSAFPGVDTRLALVVYRDTGDEYVTRSFDFSDVQTFQSELDSQSATGGGDYPEAVEKGLEAAHLLSWRDGNVARVAFLLGDAPAHAEHAGAFFAQVDRARALGIRYYPIAASGAMAEAEYQWRVLGQATLGRLLFLTDDSGIGYGHFDPHVPCYQVQYLNQLIARMIVSELSGTRVEADPGQVLRTVGDYDAGVCIADPPTQSVMTRVRRPFLRHPAITQ